MTIVIPLVIGMLAVWRATYMLQQETGPFALFARLQAWFWSEPHKEGGIKDMLRCFNCLSVWLSAIVALFLATTIIQFFAFTLAISAGAMFLNIIHSKLEQ